MPSEAAPVRMVSVANMHSLKTAILHNKRLIAACIALPLVLALLFVLATPPRYEASSEILLDPRGLVVIQNDVTPRADNNEFAVSLVESQLRIVQSEAVLRAVISQLGLDHDPEFLGRSTWLDRLRGMISLGPGEDPAITALRNLQRMVDAQRASRSYVIFIKARSNDPLKAARIADAVAAAYMNHEVEARAEAARRASSALDSRLKELAERVRSSEDAVENYKRKHNLVGSGTRLISDQQLEETNARLTEARAATAAQGSRLKQIERQLHNGAAPDAITEAVQSATISSLRTQYAEITRQAGIAAAVLGPRHPDAKAIQEQGNRLLALIAEELKRITDAVRADYTRAKNNEDELAAKLNNLKNEAAVSNEAMVRLRELERVAESNRAIYEAYLKRAKELGEQSGVDSSSTRVIAAALAPNRPTNPRSTVFLLALVAGIALAAGAVWLKRIVR